MCPHLKSRPIRRFAWCRPSVRMVVIVAIVVVLGAMLSSVIVRQVRRVKHQWAVAQVAFDLSEVGQVCSRYAASHDGRFPSNLTEVIESGRAQGILTSPLFGPGGDRFAGVEGWSKCHLVAGRRTNDPAKSVLAWCMDTSGGNSDEVLLTVDGRVKVSRLKRDAYGGCRRGTPVGGVPFDHPDPRRPKR